MDLQNTTLDDLSALIGFSATLRISAWFGGRNMYVPDHAEDGQLLVKLIGLSAAKKLTEEWGYQHISVPRLQTYDDALRKRTIGRMFDRRMGSSDIAKQMRMSTRRIQQIGRELEAAGLIRIIVPKTSRKNTPEKLVGKMPQENAPQKAPTKLPPSFVLKTKKGAK